MSSATATGEKDTERMEEENKRAVGQARTAAAGFLAMRQVESDLLTREDGVSFLDESKFPRQ
jgi:hypothetical protein